MQVVEAEAESDETSSALDVLAKKVAQVIEKAVDDQCRSGTSLGLGNDKRGGADGAGGLSTYVGLLGKSLVRCKDGHPKNGHLTRTADELDVELGLARRLVELRVFC